MQRGKTRARRGGGKRHRKFRRATRRQGRLRQGRNAEPRRIQAILHYAGHRQIGIAVVYDGEGAGHAGSGIHHAKIMPNAVRNAALPLEHPDVRHWRVDGHAAETFRRNGLQRAQPGGRHQLPTAVIAPSHHHSIALQRQGMIAPRSDGADARQSRWHHRLPIVGKGTSGPPRDHRSITFQCQGMRKSRSHRRYACQSHRHIRLARKVTPPGYHRAIAPPCQQMGTAHRHLGHPGQTRRRGRSVVHQNRAARRYPCHGKPPR